MRPRPAGAESCAVWFRPVPAGPHPAAPRPLCSRALPDGACVHPSSPSLLLCVKTNQLTAQEIILLPTGRSGSQSCSAVSTVSKMPVHRAAGVGASEPRTPRSSACPEHPGPRSTRLADGRSAPPLESIQHPRGLEHVLKAKDANEPHHSLKYILVLLISSKLNELKS